MRASISKGTIFITGKLSEESKIESIVKIMSSEFNSLCIMEAFGKDSGNEMTEYNLAYSPDEVTVKIVKESYREAKANS